MEENVDKVDKEEQDRKFLCPSSVGGWRIIIRKYTSNILCVFFYVPIKLSV